jgi:two-component system NtrC family sensor kinase
VTNAQSSAPLNTAAPSESTGQSRLGLRAQIVLALGVVLLLLFAMLAVTTAQLAGRASDAERARFADLVARALVIAVGQAPDSPSYLAAVTDRLLGQAPHTAVRVEREGKIIYQRGNGASKPSAQVAISGGGRLSLWLPEPSATARSPLTNLLLFYVALTGGAILLLTYIALTYWIVRPIEGLIQWSARLARSGQRLDVPERGAAEVRRLAVAFGQMADELRAERASLEERLRQLEQTTESLRAAQRQVVHGEKLATVGRLAAGVAHEIGNPLAAILGLAELLKGGDLSERERVEFLERIYRETERIHRIIRDLLDFARQGVESGELDVTSDLKRVVDDAVNLVKLLKEFRETRVDISRPELLPRVVGPQHRLTQVVLNLLLNAADAMEGKGVIRIEITGPAEGSPYVILSVTDSGPGIAPEVLDKLFEPFTTTKPAGKGTGLGLAVSYTLIDNLGGVLSASNPAGGGARFEVKLKKAAVASEPSP